MNYGDVAEPVVAVAIEAGAAIMEVYATDFDVQSKDDASPLTKADLASHHVIAGNLESMFPTLPIISEEGGLPDFATRSTWDSYWLIDPLDGTKEFVNRNGEFTVNIALIENGRPTLGIVHVPVTGVTYIGIDGEGAHKRLANGDRNSINVAAHSSDPVKIVGSRSHRSAGVDEYLERLGDTETVAMGSSLKFCVIAEGGADLYPRLGLTSEWDTAAAQAVVEQAGGSVVTLDGAPMRYNTKDDILNPHFLVIGPSDRDWLGALD